MLSETLLDSLALFKRRAQELDARNVVLALMVVALTALAIDYTYMLYLRSKLPPGPFPLPIVGNTLSLPENKPWIYIEQLSKKYNSAILTFWVGRNPTIWLNDAWVAHELLDKRAALYASRPRMVVFGDLGPGQKNLVSMRILSPSDRDRWRIHRKLMHLGVGVQSVRSYRRVQNAESKMVAYDILRDQNSYVKHLERYATSVVSAIAFGRRVARHDDPIITEVIALMQLAADLNVPGKKFPMLMETFPFLSRFPRSLPFGIKWTWPWMRGLGARGQKGGHYFFHALAQEALEDQACSPRPEAARSLVAKPYVETLYSLGPDQGLSVEELSNLTGNLFGAGSDTSSSTLITFILAAIAFPRPLRVAQREIDRVLGSARSPHWDDRARLPYVTAFVKEVFRWRSVAILGGQPHSPTADDHYEGYLIPRGSWVQGNVWAIHHHSRDFPEPDEFVPERYLAAQYFEFGTEPDPDPDPEALAYQSYPRPFPGEKGYATFGWGRRVCSGQALAEQGTWVTIARLLWGFSFGKFVDPVTGKEEDVDIDAYTNGLNMRPQPFRCSILPRTPELREAILREGEEALRELSAIDGESRYRMSTFYQSQKKVAQEEPVVGEDGEVKVMRV